MHRASLKTANADEIEWLGSVVVQFFIFYWDEPV